MASVLEWPAGRSFEFTVFKHVTSNTERAWVNTYWVRSKAPGTIFNLYTLVGALQSFEVLMHLPTSWIDRVEVRTGARDSDPYNPESFFSFPVGSPGTRGGAQGDPEALGIAMWMNKVTLYGREGRCMYRGVLAEGDVQSPSGVAVFQNQLNLQTLISDSVTASGLFEYFATGGNPELQLVVLGKNGEFPRPVTWFEAKGVTVGRKNRGWYNRTPAAEANEYPDQLDVDQLAAADGAVAAIPEGYIEAHIEGTVSGEFD